MFFGMGPGALLVVLLPLFVLGMGVGIALLAARRFLGVPTRRAGLADAQTERLIAELREMRDRLGTMEAQVAQMDESLAFTQAQPAHHLARDPEYLIELPRKVQILEIVTASSRDGAVFP